MTTTAMTKRAPRRPAAMRERTVRERVPQDGGPAAVQYVPTYCEIDMTGLEVERLQALLALLIEHVPEQIFLAEGGPGWLLGLETVRDKLWDIRLELDAAAGNAPDHPEGRVQASKEKAQ